MRMDRARPYDGPIIRGFAAGGFRIDKGAVHHALLLTPTSAIEWNPPPIERLDRAALAAILETAPEFVLLGTGAALARPPRDLIQALETDGIGIEPMDSRAAARAWGVLRGEGRRIAAALYPLDR